MVQVQVEDACITGLPPPLTRSNTLLPRCAYHFLPPARRYEDEGKLLTKKNTFSDFISCGEHLVASGWADAGRLSAMGASAGGLLMGAVANMRPDMWRAIVSQVGFVDVLVTMADPSIPLTVT